MFTSIGTIFEVQISRGFAYVQLVGWGALGARATTIRRSGRRADLEYLC
jgi:hypothetical protein